MELISFYNNSLVSFKGTFLPETSISAYEIFRNITHESLNMMYLDVLSGSTLSVKEILNLVVGNEHTATVSIRLDEHHNVISSGFI